MVGLGNPEVLFGVFIVYIWVDLNIFMVHTTGNGQLLKKCSKAQWIFGIWNIIITLSIPLYISHYTSDLNIKTDFVLEYLTGTSQSALRLSMPCDKSRWDYASCSMRKKEANKKVNIEEFKDPLPCNKLKEDVLNLFNSVKCLVYPNGHIELSDLRSDLKWAFSTPKGILYLKF